MRITKIEITNFRAFEGTYIIELNDKQHTNLLVYGENIGFNRDYNSLLEFYQNTVKHINENDGGSIPATNEKNYLEYFYIKGTEEQKLKDIVER